MFREVNASFVGVQGEYATLRPAVRVASMSLFRYL